MSVIFVSCCARAAARRPVGLSPLGQRAMEYCILQHIRQEYSASYISCTLRVCTTVCASMQLLSAHAAQEMHQSSSGSVSMAKEGAAGEGQTNSPCQPQEVPSHGSVPDVGPSRCMSALEMKKLHRGVSGRFTDDTQTQDAEHGLKKQQDVDKAVLRVFLEYARFGTRDKKARTLDVYRFMKLIRECSLMTSPDSAAAVDLIFCKVRVVCGTPA